MWRSDEEKHVQFRLTSSLSRNSSSSIYALINWSLKASTFEGCFLVTRGASMMKISAKKTSHFDREANPADTYLRDYRNRSSLFDNLEEGGLRPTSSFQSSEIDEQENERGVSVLQDRVSALKMLTADIHDEVNGHNRLLERMEQDMDSNRGVLAGTVDRFRRVFDTKSGQNIVTTVAVLVLVFLLVYYFLK